ncbi:hypothetical protein HK101_005531 [Irineochytrium annulatum]|nr:hypothetical protein HK101_005531 [Irineochytrium annulatum]
MLFLPAVSIGNPYETYTIGGVKLPRYKVAMYVLFGYAGLFTAWSVYSRFQPKKPIHFQSKEEEDYVKRYIEHSKHESHKPRLAREAYMGPSGLN